MTARVVEAIVPPELQASSIQEDRLMEPILMTADNLASDDEVEILVHAWRTEQLRRLGLSRLLAEAFADHVDWHALAQLVERGCSPELALDILR